VHLVHPDACPGHASLGVELEGDELAVAEKATEVPSSALIIAMTPIRSAGQSWICVR
jgi:hypothetical protein